MDRLVWQGLDKDGEGWGMVQRVNWLIGEMIKGSYSNFPGKTKAPPLRAISNKALLIARYSVVDTPQLNRLDTMWPPPVLMMFLGQFSAKKSFPHVKNG